MAWEQSWLAIHLQEVSMLFVRGDDANDDPSSVAQMVWYVQASSPACPVDCPVRVLRAGSRREHGEAPHA